MMKKKGPTIITEELIEPVNKWWRSSNFGQGNAKWSGLQTNGFLFAPEYEPCGVPVLVLI